MPRLVRLYIVNVLIGLVLAVCFTGLLLLLDVGGLRHLVLGSASGWLAGLMLIVFNCIVFSGVQFGFAIMRLADSPPPSGGRGVRLYISDPVRQHSCAQSGRKN